MNEFPLPTAIDIDRLIVYLPVLYAEGFKPVRQWNGGQKGQDGVITLPWPEYEETVTDFFHLAAEDCWMDYHYNPSEMKQFLMNEESIETANINEIRSALTYCVRGERFCDGHWAVMIEKGYIRQILERLAAIKQEIDY